MFLMVFRHFSGALEGFLMVVGGHLKSIQKELFWRVSGEILISQELAGNALRNVLANMIIYIICFY